jgi:hypothetical protein
MVDAAWSGAADNDGLVLLIDAHAVRNGMPDRDTQGIVTALKNQNRSAIVVLNKIDAVERGSLLNLAAWVDAQGIAKSVFMVSALNGDGVTDLLVDLTALAPKGPWHYPEDQISEIPLRRRPHRTRSPLRTPRPPLPLRQSPRQLGRRPRTLPRHGPRFPQRVGPLCDAARRAAPQDEVDPPRRDIQDAKDLQVIISES